MINLDTQLRDAVKKEEKLEVNGHYVHILRNLIRLRLRMPVLNVFNEGKNRYLVNRRL